MCAIFSKKGFVWTPSCQTARPPPKIPGGRRAFRCVSSGRCGLSLLFAEQETVCTCCNQRDSVPRPRHETVIPYRLIDQAPVIPERQIFRIHAGGKMP